MTPGSEGMPRMLPPTIYLLIGPKGSGKSYIGSLLQREHAATFVRVEEWAREIRRERSIDDPGYLREVFGAIERGVREVLQEHHLIAFESVGLSDQFDAMLRSLRKDFRVITVRVEASDETCLQRVRSRDVSQHVDISDAGVRQINDQVRKRNMKTDAVLVNDGPDAARIREQLAHLVRAVLADEVDGR